MTYFHEEQRFGRWLWVLVLVFGGAAVIPLIGRPVPLAALAFGPIVIALVVALISPVRPSPVRRIPPGQAGAGRE